MPLVNEELDANVKLAVSKRFIIDNTVKIILLHEHDWNEPKLIFQGRTIARSEENNKAMYDVLLDEANGHILKLSEGSIKYINPLTTPVAQEIVVDTTVVETEDFLEDAINEDEEEEAIDLTSSRGWNAGEVYINSRLSGSAKGFTSLNSRLNMNNGRYASPLDYFLFFLPMDHFYSIIHNTNVHARSLGH